MKILFVSPEVFPFAKTGGLADVAGALPLALKKLGHDVRIMMPKYKCVDHSAEELKDINRKIFVPIGPEVKGGKLFEGSLFQNVPVYFLDNPDFYNRDHLYGEHYQDYEDNASRFIFFSRGILEACKAVDFKPDIIHCNDWQTGLVPVYLKTFYQQDPFFAGTKTVFTIHNLGYQGNFWHFDIPLAHLPWDIFNIDGVEFYGKFSFLKSGLVYSDVLTTVSKSYSEEICTSEHGFNMEGVLRRRKKDLYGILNGVDYSKWNPAVNPWIKKNYSLEKLEGKLDCREDLVNELGLKINKNTPVICFVNRLCSQKGIDLLIDGMQFIMKQGAAFVAIGTGHMKYQDFFHSLAKRFPGRCAKFIGYQETLAHKALAGSDMMLLPSQYEPCGLTQLYGLKYGSVPIVRSIGGLKDTIQSFSIASKKGTGFKFRGFAISHMHRSIKRAITVFKDQALWKHLLINGMSKDYGWNRSAGQYSKLYTKVLAGRKEAVNGSSIGLNRYN